MKYIHTRVLAALQMQTLGLTRAAAETSMPQHFKQQQQQQQQQRQPHHHQQQQQQQDPRNVHSAGRNRGEYL